MSISQTVRDFITLAIQSGGWMEMDRIYLENRVIALIGETTLTKTEVRPVTVSAVELVDSLLDQALKNQQITDNMAERDILAAQLMDFMTPPPSVVNAYFAQYYSKDPIQATDYFYKISTDNDYIKTRDIARNIHFPAKTAYGELQITINLSKPEKDPKDIAAASKESTSDYPNCLLCMENEGYKGRVNYPARTNHRIIRMNLNGESWGFQYSLYAYYDEHCIILSEEHRPMQITKATFQRLLKITEVLPHYFVGSNADLPIVGGSILSHTHFQGGRYVFPMQNAAVLAQYLNPQYSKLCFATLKWPVSTLRVTGRDKAAMLRFAQEFLAAWREYSDADADIMAYTDENGV
ncbi:MAG: UDP-glucose--hexose-1-phosphate uridylyltransferase, partial [Enterococcus sp.]